MIEGIKLITDVAKNQPDLLEFLVVDKNFDQIPNIIQCDVYTTNEDQFNELSHMMHPQGIMAICRIPETFFSGIWTADQFALFFDSVQDPGNLGTMLRAAEWYGVNDILIGPGTVDPYSPKVVQASMGSHSYMNIYSCTYHQVSEYSGPVLAAVMDGKNVYDYHWPENGILILGNEGQGISKTALRSATDYITLPSSPETRTESLNVGMACTALLTVRQGFYRNK